MAVTPEAVGMGRRYAPDERDNKYPMRLALAAIEERFPSFAAEGSRHYRPGKVWVQGKTGTCVEHGTRHWMEAAPIMQQLPYPQFDFYRKIVKDDEWSDNDHEATAPVEQLQSGTSVRASLEQLRKDGLVKQYLWARTVADIRAWHLAGFGGTILGLPWKTGMFDADTTGFINATGVVEGGHCVSTTGWNDRVRRNGKYVRAVRIQQSWQLPWGDGGDGRAWLLEDDLAKLLADQGEAAAPTQVRVIPLAA
jgi:hypothetical protein